jgi:hypothetical protein
MFAASCILFAPSYAPFAASCIPFAPSYAPRRCLYTKKTKKQVNQKNQTKVETGHKRSLLCKENYDETAIVQLLPSLRGSKGIDEDFEL